MFSCGWRPDHVVHVKSLGHSKKVRGHGQPEGRQSWSRTLQRGRQGFELVTLRLKVQTLRSHKHEGELQSVQSECWVLPSCVWPCFCLSLNSAGGFLARPPPGWRLECWHNRCCLTKPIIICCTAVRPYPLFLLPLHILLHLLRLLRHLCFLQLVSDSAAPSDIVFKFQLKLVRVGSPKYLHNVSLPSWGI